MGEFGQAEVQDLRLPATGNKDVCRLDVAMDESLLMRRVQAVGYLNGQIQQDVHR